VKHLHHDVSWVRTPNQTVLSLASGTHFDALVINTEMFTKKKLDIVKNLRAVGCDYPVMFLADVIKDMHAIPQNLRTMVVDKPVHAGDLEGLIERAVTRNNFGVRYHKRFSTDEIADYEIFRNGRKSTAILKNLSLGGAFLETSETYQAGEILKMYIRLNSISKSHELSARVVWNSHHPDHRGTRGLGLRFVRPGEVYDTALVWAQ
jgi:hypothetical protein